MRNSAETLMGAIGAVGFLILFVLALVLGVFWLIFPWMVYHRLNGLIKAIYTVNHNLMSGHNHLRIGVEALNAKLNQIASLIGSEESRTSPKTEPATGVSPVTNVVEPSGLRIVHGACKFCGCGLEFESEHTGQTIVCPHCGGETTLEAIA